MCCGCAGAGGAWSASSTRHLEKALEVAKLLPGVKLVHVSRPDVRVPEGVIGFVAALKAQDGSRLSFAVVGKDDDVAAYSRGGFCISSALGA